MASLSSRPGSVLRGRRAWRQATRSRRGSGHWVSARLGFGLTSIGSFERARMWFMSSKMLVKVMAHRSIHFNLKFISTASGKIEFLGLYVTFLHTSLSPSTTTVNRSTTTGQDQRAIQPCLCLPLSLSRSFYLCCY